MAGADAPADADYAAGDFVAAYEESIRIAVAAFAVEGALDKTVRLPFGEFPGAVLRDLAAMEQLTHGWDLARAIGQCADVDAELAAWLLGKARLAIPDELRGPEGQALFGPAVEPPAALGRGSACGLPRQAGDRRPIARHPGTGASDTSYSCGQNGLAIRSLVTVVCEPRGVIVLLSTSDTDLLSARASGADYRLGNPARARRRGPARHCSTGPTVVVVRILGGRRAWEDGLDAVLAAGVPVVVLGGEQARTPS